MSAPKLFGTDGVRGAFGEPPLDRETVVALGAEVGRALAASEGTAPLVVLGGDTRDSTPILCRWLAAGLATEGTRVRFAGTIPTPGVARLVRRLGAATGFAVSASHNPHPDNGIKLIDREGFKWSPAAERELETRIHARRSTSAENRDVDLTPETDLVDAYLEEIRETSAVGDLAGLKIALDTANGAAVGLAPRLFSALGAEVVALGDEPDGTNINRDCGSTRPEKMARRVAESGCDLGFAFDGDADRVIPADATGRVWDGDALLYLLAGELAARGELEPPRIVATSMSNLGLEVALAARGIKIERCDVGDRVVVETLKRSRLRLGGEQSGHIVDLVRSTSGDGLLTALVVAGTVAANGGSLADHLAGFRRFPQILRNVRVASKPDLGSVPAVARAAAEVEAELGERGRLVLRYSGTEPLARVMIEGPDGDEVERLTARLATVIERELGA